MTGLSRLLPQSNHSYTQPNYTTITSTFHQYFSALINQILCKSALYGLKSESSSFSKKNVRKNKEHTQKFQ